MRRRFERMRTHMFPAPPQIGRAQPGERLHFTRPCSAQPRVCMALRGAAIGRQRRQGVIEKLPARKGPDSGSAVAAYGSPAAGSARGRVTVNTLQPSR